MFKRYTHVADGTENCLYAHQGKTKVSFDEKSQWQQPKLTLDKCGADTRAINGNKGQQSKTRIMKAQRSPPPFSTPTSIYAIVSANLLSGHLEWKILEFGGRQLIHPSSHIKVLDQNPTAQSGYNEVQLRQGLHASQAWW